MSVVVALVEGIGKFIIGIGKFIIGLPQWTQELFLANPLAFIVFVLLLIVGYANYQHESQLIIVCESLLDENGEFVKGLSRRAEKICSNNLAEPYVDPNSDWP